MQRNWLGKSEGVTLRFEYLAQDSESKDMTVFTTRPDTLFGVQYVALAVDHPIVQRYASNSYLNFVKSSQQQSLSAQVISLFAFAGNFISLIRPIFQILSLKIPC